MAPCACVCVGGGGGGGMGGGGGGVSVNVISTVGYLLRTQHLLSCPVRSLPFPFSPGFLPLPAQFAESVRPEQHAGLPRTQQLGQICQ